MFHPGLSIWERELIGVEVLESGILELTGGRGPRSGDVMMPCVVVVCARDAERDHRTRVRPCSSEGSAGCGGIDTKAYCTRRQGEDYSTLEGVLGLYTSDGGGRCI